MVRKAFAIVLITFAFLLTLGVGTAAAASVHDGGNGGAPTLCTQMAYDEAIQPVEYLPINRWSTTSIHSRSSSAIWDIKGQANNLSSSVGITTSLTVAGATLQLSSRAVELATQFCIADSTTTLTDEISERFGEVIIENIAPLAIICAFSGFVWVSRNGIPMWTKLTAPMACLAALVVMTYVPAMRPGAVSTQILNFGNSIANTSVQALDDAVTDWVARLPSSRSVGEQSCSKYMEGLDSQFRNKDGSATSAAGNMNRMFVVTQLASWRTIQFGYGPYGDKVYCHILERDARISPENQVSVYKAAGMVAPSVDSWVLNANPESNDLTDEVGVAFAACESRAGKWVVSDGWKFDDHEIKDEDCQKAFTTSERPGGAFDFGSGDDYIEQTSGEAKEFMSRWHATDPTRDGGVLNASLAALAGVILLFIIGGIAFMSVLSKIGLLLMCMLAPFALLRGIFPGAENTLKPWFNRLVKSTGIVIMVPLTLNLLCFFIGMMAYLSYQMSPTVSSLMVLGAPVGGIIALHMLFKSQTGASLFSRSTVSNMFGGSPAQAAAFGAFMGGRSGRKQFRKMAGQSGTGGYQMGGPLANRQRAGGLSPVGSDRRNAGDEPSLDSKRDAVLQRQYGASTRAEDESTQAAQQKYQEDLQKFAAAQKVGGVKRHEEIQARKERLGSREDDSAFQAKKKALSRAALAGDVAMARAGTAVRRNIHKPKKATVVKVAGGAALVAATGGFGMIAIAATQGTKTAYRYGNPRVRESRSAERDLELERKFVAHRQRENTVRLRAETQAQTQSQVQQQTEVEPEPEQTAPVVQVHPTQRSWDTGSPAKISSTEAITTKDITGTLKGDAARPLHDEGTVE